MIYRKAIPILSECTKISSPRHSIHEEDEQDHHPKIENSCKTIARLQILGKTNALIFNKVEATFQENFTHNYTYLFQKLGGSTPSPPAQFLLMLNSITPPIQYCHAKFKIVMDS